MLSWYFLESFCKKGLKISINDGVYKVLIMRIPQVRFIYKPIAFLIFWRASIWAGSFFSPWPAARPGSAQEIVLACLQKNTGRGKQTGQARKNNFDIVFLVLAWDGKLTIKFTCPYPTVWYSSPIEWWRVGRQHNHNTSYCSGPYSPLADPSRLLSAGMP